MKGKPILVPVKEPKEGMKVVCRGVVYILREYHPKCCYLDTKDRDLYVEGSELQQIAIEYMTYHSADNRVEENGLKQLLLSPDDYEKALPLIGQEVEFIIWTGGRHVIGEPEFEPVAWIQDTPKEETWDDIWGKICKHLEATGGKYVGQGWEWMTENYHVPKKK